MASRLRGMSRRHESTLTWEHPPREVPGDGQQAGSKDFSEIVYDIFDVPFFNPFNPATLPQLLVVVYGSIADMVARSLTSWFHKRYFIRKPVHLGDLKTRRLRVELIKMWHDRGTKCFWRAIGFTFVAFAASIALSTRVSHRRAAVVVLCWLRNQLCSGLFLSGTEVSASEIERGRGEQRKRRGEDLVQAVAKSSVLHRTTCRQPRLREKTGKSVFARTARRQ